MVAPASPDSRFSAEPPLTAAWPRDTRSNPDQEVETSKQIMCAVLNAGGSHDSDNREGSEGRNTDEPPGREQHRMLRAGIPPKIPGCKLLRLIGMGAYGEVWLAQADCGTYRAVKVVWREDFSLREFYEQELSGTLFYEPLSHDNYGLVPILQVGQHEQEGRKYFYCVMELADDTNSRGISAPDSYCPRTLANAMSRYGRRPIPLDSVLAVGVHLAHGLCRLHEAGLTHGDIKPSNIVFIHGQPRLTDAGMVSPPGQPHYSGTTGYIPPEGSGSRQADVYALTMVLYEMATGLDRLEFPSLPPGLPEGNKRWLAFNLIMCAAADPVATRRRINTAMQLGRRLESLRHPRLFPSDNGCAGKCRSSLRMLLYLSMVLLAVILTTLLLLPDGFFSRLPEAWKVLMGPLP